MISFNEVKDLRKELLERLYYIQLIASLTPKGYGGITEKDVKESIIEIGNFIKNSTDKEMSIKGNNVYHLLVQIYNNYKQLYKPKIGQRRIGKEFNEWFISQKNPYSTGIKFGWLDSRIEFLKEVFPNDLPYHANIGIGVHASAISIEEEYILKDAFFLLVQAESTFDKMIELYDTYKREKKDIESSNDYLSLSNFNYTIATYSRLGLQSFYFFVEAFVNSIGYDFYLRNRNNLSHKDIDILHGKKKGRYVPLENRIENFQSIIRADKRIIINTTDDKQIKDPFKTFFGEIKAIRDTASHFSPIKGIIWYKPNDWLEKVKMSARLGLELSKEFWLACYPNKDLPEYLDKLDYNVHFDLAKKRAAGLSKPLSELL